MTTILFLHGWHSVPGGVKPTYLKEHGHKVINPALDDEVSRWQSRLRRSSWEVLVAIGRHRVSKECRCNRTANYGCRPRSSQVKLRSLVVRALCHSLRCFRRWRDCEALKSAS